jgi:hypothetical protein
MHWCSMPSFWGTFWTHRHRQTQHTRLKVKLSLCLFNEAWCYEDMWGSGGIAPTCLTLVLDGGEWSASCPGHFIPGERGPGIHWIGGWVGPVVGVDTLGQRKTNKHLHFPVQCWCGLTPHCLLLSPMFRQPQYLFALQFLLLSENFAICWLSGRLFMRISFVGRSLWLCRVMYFIDIMVL